jgi:hypothetical protein
MNCEEAKRELALVLGGIDDREARGRLAEHAAECPDCAGKLEKASAIAAARGSQKPVQEPDWERSWREIKARSFQGRRQSLFRVRRNRWAFAAAVAVVFVLGAIAGRIFLFGPKAAAPEVVFAGMDTESAWRAYADRLELLLIDVGNRTEAERPKDMVRLERAMVEHILAETRSLKTLLAGDEEDVRVSLLTEAEILLAKIASLKPGEKSSGRDASRLVRESALRAKLNSILDSEPIL